MKKPTGSDSAQSCERCRYWHEGTEKAESERWGWCFYEPPVVLGIDDEDVIVATPWTKLPRHCHNFAPRIND